MNTTPKKSMLFTLMFALASLTACVGGGGGGGGGGVSTPLAPTISISEITEGMTQQEPLAEDYSNASQGLGATLTTDGLTAGGSGGSADVTIVHGNSIDVIASYGSSEDPKVLHEFHFADLLQYGETKADLVIASGEMTDETSQFFDLDRKGDSYDHADFSNVYEDPYPILYFTGTSLGGTEFLILNSNMIDLEYSSFGIWGAKTGHVGTAEWNGQSQTYTEADPYTEVCFIPFSGGKSENIAVPEANTTFTGKAIAMAARYGGTTHESPLHDFFRGDAELTLDARNGSSLVYGKLLLSFPNFYNIELPINVTLENGAITGQGTATLTDNGNKSEFKFTGETGLVPVSGQFYGPSKDSASEASGSFRIDAMEESGAKTMLDGAFGLKKK